MFGTSGADRTPRDNERKSYKYTCYLSSFMRYNLITFTKVTQNDHFAFEDKPARVLVLDLVTLSIVVPQVTKKFKIL